MCILASVLDDDVHNMCVTAWVLDDYAHICLGFGRLCAYLRRFWMTMYMLASVLDDNVHSCVGDTSLPEVCPCKPI